MNDHINTDKAIEIQNLGREFGQFWAVRGVDLSVNKGEIFGLVGPDGAGKTTVMRMAAGVLLPTEGNIIVNGYSVISHPETVKKNIGYMSQKFGLYGDLTVLENLRFYGDLYEIPRKNRDTAEDKLLGFSNLTPFKNRKAKDLSGGMKQKLGLACSLIHQPAVLLLDEPTNGVDPVSRRDFWKILHEMVKEGVTVFVSTSYLDEAERCERVGMMQEGRLTMCDNPRNLKKTISGSILEIISDDPGKALEALKKRYGKMSSDIVSGIIRFRMPENSSPEKIEDEMKDMGVPPLSINEARPTLEDVFVSQALKAGPL
jgi:ABC-2 type transport system ATP-binding protein